MQVYALVGPSGTGKSHRALFVAHEHQIEMIIDDGLLIQESRIITGLSAKRSSTKVGAIKTALFSDESHALNVKEKIQELNPNSILILGTSLGMIEKIANRLNLSQPQKIIKIEDIASRSEIEKAKLVRSKYGTHVVPAPSVEVKQKFSGNIINPLRTFFKKRNPDHHTVPPKQLWVEQTVVRPTFNFLGNFYITNNVISEITKHVCHNIKGINSVISVHVDTTEQGIKLHIDTNIEYGHIIPDVVIRAQSAIKNHIEQMTSLNVLSIDLHIKKLIFEV